MKKRGFPDITERPEAPAMKKPYDMDWDELQAHIDIFDQVEVNYYDGKPHSDNIENNYVQVLRVAEVTPAKRADGKVILHIATAPFTFKGVEHEPKRLHVDESVGFTQEQVDALVEEARLQAEYDTIDRVVKYNDAMNKEHNYQLIERMKTLDEEIHNSRS